MYSTIMIHEKQHNDIRYYYLFVFFELLARRVLMYNNVVQILYYYYPNIFNVRLRVFNCFYIAIYNTIL